MNAQRLIRLTQSAVAVVTVAAVAFLLLSGHTGPAVGVGVAGAVLVAALALVQRQAAPSRQEALSAGRRERNLALALRLGHALTAIGLASIAVGAVLSATGSGDDTVARILLMSAGPFAIAAGLGAYTGYTVMRRDLTRDGRSG
ncbi:hypothetical protein GXB85_05925 [Cellulomonas sp. APG4]|uniref:hypothetical protein n=1 Tax=Cellulomonas sp. APG4 TaxID=1538656 RepID=UPI00137B06B7|nr:hypothetical protein [Cellulomonas sp. APG4]NCT90486.1 hypothetical protein [Cellulomonas sp. APG4]